MWNCLEIAISGVMNQYWVVSCFGGVYFGWRSEAV